MRLKEQQQGNGSSGGGGKSAAAAAAPGPDPSDDPFTASLSKILSSTGGVQQERHVPLLLQLVRRARSKAHRTALLVVLQRSAAEVQRQAVAGKLLLELQSWLSDAVAEGDAKRAQNCLACLDKLPVTLAALQPPCELGKVVGKLRKHESFGAAITDTAKRLVARWKGVVEAAQAKKAASGTAGGNARSATQLPLPLTPAALRLPCTCVICSTHSARKSVLIKLLPECLPVLRLLGLEPPSQALPWPTIPPECRRYIPAIHDHLLPTPTVPIASRLVPPVQCNSSSQAGCGNSGAQACSRSSGAQASGAQAGSGQHGSTRAAGIWQPGKHGGW